MPPGLHFDPLPRPRLTLLLAVTGRRPGIQFTIGNMRRVAGEMDHCLTRIEAALREIAQEAETIRAYSADAPELRMISALAEGADRIGAEVALRHGWTLEAVLPFPRDTYEQDFASAASRKQYRALLADAHSVLEIDAMAAGAPAAASYAMAGTVLLDNCDLLIAVWDGKPGEGRGGTSDVVAGAVERSIPVLRIHATDATAHPAMLIGHSGATAGLSDETEMLAILRRFLAAPTNKEEL